MRFTFFVHSLVSDWNHGNAHFIRGVVSELLDRGHDVTVYEPAGGWSRTNLVEEQGHGAVAEFRERFPRLDSIEYGPDTEWGDVIDGSDVVIVHEWNDPALVAAVGAVGSATDAVVLFHDTHHRAATAPEDVSRFDLSGYDGVLAFGEIIRRMYLERGWTDHAWVWHEAADTRVFRPRQDIAPAEDLVWVGNWADDERQEELEEFLLGPAAALSLTGSIHGVRYPDHALRAIERSGLRFGGWVPNARVPEVFAAHRVTVHVPRRPYARRLPGIPTIRMFEALACGIPLVSASWDDAESLFRPGDDYLVARDGEEMTSHLKEILHDGDLARGLADSGLETIRGRHTCAHRVDELMTIVEEVSA